MFQGCDSPGMILGLDEGTNCACAPSQLITGNLCMNIQHLTDDLDRHIVCMPCRGEWRCLGGAGRLGGALRTQD